MQHARVLLYVRIIYQYPNCMAAASAPRTWEGRSCRVGGARVVCMREVQSALSSREGVHSSYPAKFLPE